MGLKEEEGGTTVQEKKVKENESSPKMFYYNLFEIQSTTCQSPRFPSHESALALLPSILKFYFFFFSTFQFPFYVWMLANFDLCVVILSFYTFRAFSCLAMIPKETELFK